MNETPTRIAILSGKGGAGKTFVSTNLAYVGKATYIDCDVEEPNGSLFFQTPVLKRTPVMVKIPQIDSKKCTGCRQCVSFCQFSALAFINKQVKVFEEVCHSCGGCSLVCPEQAITEKGKIIGWMEESISDSVHILSGKLNIGEESGVPIIKDLIHYQRENNLEIIDCPPGTSCSVIESVSSADYCIIVGEETLYSLENLKLVVDLLEKMKIPFGVVINKSTTEESELYHYCSSKQIRILSRIPYMQEYQYITSKGELLSKYSPSGKIQFDSLLKAVKEAIR